jgi:L-asparaginase / beta-aspartyl-peptidase
MLKNVIAVIAHSGVTNVFRTAERTKPKLKTTIEAVIAAFELLIQKKNAVEGVVCAVNIMESSGNTNSGKGSVLQLDDKQRMDATIMKSDLDCGAVASLRGFENPISIAKMIMEKSKENNHYFYSHDYASSIASKTNKFKTLKISTNNQEKGKKDKEVHGETVGAVALDGNSMLCAGTSTGGRSKCSAGRIGDSAIIGSGTYCNEHAAVSNTGFGEWIVKLTCAKRIVDLIQYQLLTPQVATDMMSKEYMNVCDKTLGSICLDQFGKWGISITGKSMNWAMVRKEGGDAPMLYYGCGRGEIFTEKLDF